MAQTPGERPGLTKPVQHIPADLRHLHRSEPVGRGLLVLDGKSCSAEVKRAALKYCTQLVDRVDILLVNPPKAPITLLHDLLIKLEQAGIDYRLTNASGKLADQVAHHLRRFLGISTVIVDVQSRLVQELEPELARICGRGCRFVTLAAPNPAA